jgi:predicted polyphosphate/ATP-dependent NAD kinase
MQEYSHRKAVVSIMGGQGHVFGRGNQQFSPRILRALGKLNILLASTKTKITALNGRPLIIDSGDATLDQEWHGTVEVITGYNDRIVYPIA